MGAFAGGCPKRRSRRILKFAPQRTTACSHSITAAKMAQSAVSSWQRGVRFSCLRRGARLAESGPSDARQPPARGATLSSGPHGQGWAGHPLGRFVNAPCYNSEMSETPAPKRRWLQFSLGALFLTLTFAPYMIAVVVPPAVTGYAEWRARRALDDAFDQIMKAPPQVQPHLLDEMVSPPTKAPDFRLAE
jgi:hypothetical protein